MIIIHLEIDVIDITAWYVPAKRLADRLLDSRSCTSHEMEDYGDYGKNQKNVDEESCDMKDEKSA